MCVCVLCVCVCYLGSCISNIAKFDFMPESFLTVLSLVLDL